MAYGVIAFTQPGNTFSTAPVGLLQSMPSPSVWADCQSQELIDEGNGFFFNNDFTVAQTLPGQPNSGTFVGVSSTDHALSMSGTSTGAAMWTSTLGPIAPNGTSKLWFETNVCLQSSTLVASIFVGLTTSTGLVATSVVTSSTAPGFTLTSTAGYIGFVSRGTSPNNFDAVYQKGGSTAALASTIVVLSSTLTSPANNPNPGNVNFVPSTAPGVFNGTNWVKLGVRVDKSYAYWYVNGWTVAKKLLDSTFDTVDSYGGIIAETGASTTANLVNVSFFRVAAKISGQI
jgi:hypothetical protein